MRLRIQSSPEGLIVTDEWGKPLQDVQSLAVEYEDGKVTACVIVHEPLLDLEVNASLLDLSEDL
mgnify:CR=1 FL=1|jgi:hypothetical protein